MDEDRRRQLRRQYKEAQRHEAWVQLGLSRDQLHDLQEWLSGRGADLDCDHTLVRTLEWVRRAGADAADVVAGLERLGGFCDCEVLLNVHPDDVV